MRLNTGNVSGIKTAMAVLVCFCFLFASGSQPGRACDSTLLEILTGSSPEQSVAEKLLVISSKMQVTAALSQAFNHASAEKQHHEVMDLWLHVAAQITSNPPGNAGSDSGFHPLITQISRDLGTVRQQIVARQMEVVHDRLEICVSRMSLLASIITGHKRMREFLEFELLVLGLRPLLQSFEESRAAVVATDFAAALASLNLPETSDINDQAFALKKQFATFRDSFADDQKAFSNATLTSYLALYNEFSALKKLLLAAKYFSDS